nr:integrator complex subunit 11 [Tanacetum cinerariifolium]
MINGDAWVKDGIFIPEWVRIRRNNGIREISKKDPYNVCQKRRVIILNCGTATTNLFNMIVIEIESFIIWKGYIRMSSGTATTNLSQIKVEVFKFGQRIMKGVSLLQKRVKRSGGRLVEAIHLIRSLMEKYRERQRDMHMAFLDLEKAYDSVPRELNWKTLVDKGSSMGYIKVIRDMYDGAKTRVRTFIRNTEFFPMDVRLHQGSAISPYLFALILDELSKEI